MYVDKDMSVVIQSCLCLPMALYVLSEQGVSGRPDSDLGLSQNTFDKA